MGERDIDWSPDGEEIVFMSDRSGAVTLWIVEVETGVTRQLTDHELPWSMHTGDTQAGPRWSPDGGTIFFITRGGMWAASVRLDSRATVEAREELFATLPYRNRGVLVAEYDVHPDGERFIMIKRGIEASRPQINVVLNWFEELKQRVPTGR